MLTLEDVTAGYGGGNVLQGVSLSCDAGTVTCIVGPNGAGKSTVLKVISGLLGCRTGSVSLSGARMDGLDPARILALGITQVPQSQALFPGMSVRENVLLGGYLIRRNRKLLAARYAAVCDRIPLVASRAGDQAGNLSGGQRRMVEIARCLMLSPKLLLLDEPSLGLAPLVTREIFRIVRELNEKDGLTVLVVEQNAAIALDVAAQAYVLEVGKVAVSGSSAELARDESVRKSYLGY